MTPHELAIRFKDFLGEKHAVKAHYRVELFLIRHWDYWLVVSNRRSLSSRKRGDRLFIDLLLTLLSEASLKTLVGGVIHDDAASEEDRGGKSYGHQ